MSEVSKQGTMYRRRAEELRIEAGAIIHAETKQSLLTIAGSYDKLAALIEGRIRDYVRSK